MIFQHGEPVITLSDLVSNFSVEQGNMQQKHFIKNLTHAKWVYKELLHRSIWAIRQTVLTVEDGKIRLPNDVSRLVNLSVVDHAGNQQPIGFNPNMNTVEILCSAKPCSCKCGGTDTMCSSFDNLTMTTEPVVIKGTTYTQTTWIKNMGNGDIVEYKKVPVFSATAAADTGSVVFDMQQRLICTMELTSTGCIAATDKNKQLFFNNCGCYTTLPYRDVWTDCFENNEVPGVNSQYGNWNWNAAARDIIHLKDVSAKKIIVGFQSSGEADGQEIVIPENTPMIDAMQIGMMWRQAMYNPNTPYRDKEGAKRMYRDAKMELNKFLRPISMVALSRLQTYIPKW